MENVYVEEDRRPMSGSEIAEVLGVSRMAVSQALKRAVKKIYYLLKKANKHLDSFDIAVMMSQILSVSLDSESEMNKFFNLFPGDIKKEIKHHAKDRFRSCDQCTFKTLC